jgi:hypothetical protein
MHTVCLNFELDAYERIKVDDNQCMDVHSHGCVLIWQTIPEYLVIAGLAKGNKGPFWSYPCGTLQTPKHWIVVSGFDNLGANSLKWTMRASADASTGTE